MEWVALILSWATGFVWWGLAWGALGGSKYTADWWCSYALRGTGLNEWSTTIEDRALYATAAIVILLGGAFLAWFASRPVARQIAAKQASSGAIVLLIVSFIPLAGAVSGIGLPYVLGLNIRARGVARPVRRRILVPLACAACVASAVLWGDAVECL